MYQITAEVKKSYQSPAKIFMRSKTELTEQDLIKRYSSYYIGVIKHKCDVQVKNFKCVRV